LPGSSRSWVPINFLIDTGAAITLLRPLDAIGRLQLDPLVLAQPLHWPNRQPISGVTGSGECYVHPAEYAFLHEDGRLQRIAGEICIDPPNQTNNSRKSLLGWDVLQHFRLSVDWSGRRITLE
jgi:hypothetical protein